MELYYYIPAKRAFLGRYLFCCQRVVLLLNVFVEIIRPLSHHDRGITNVRPCSLTEKNINTEIGETTRRALNCKWQVQHFITERSTGLNHDTFKNAFKNGFKLYAQHVHEHQHETLCTQTALKPLNLTRCIRFVLICNRDCTRRVVQCICKHI